MTEVGIESTAKRRCERPGWRLAATYNFNHSHFTREAGRNSRQQCRSRRTDPGGWRFDSGPGAFLLLFLPVFQAMTATGYAAELVERLVALFEEECRKLIDRVE